ncbi:MAG: YjfB family protein [Butyrivibrio sp.]|uniref:YjfB family protein n=1 Tax=Butyrivibrio sp. TaxID=28121 RepID=UPI001B084FB2|nr:YjfB family protein [Butyrivibrio sp.]MBO6242611.1 YjfB family protein [Butyrivibrio sp.]
MDIPALSMVLAQNKVLTDVGVAMLSKNLDLMEDVGSSLIEGIDAVSELSVNPDIGGNIDIRI